MPVPNKIGLQVVGTTQLEARLNQIHHLDRRTSAYRLIGGADLLWRER
jgi:hypothetical protein